VIGMDTQKSLKRFVQKLPERFEVAEGRGTICGVLLDLDENSGLCRTITRLRIDESIAQTTIKVA
jgi:calcineurin-like phosphoesterase